MELKRNITHVTSILAIACSTAGTCTPLSTGSLAYRSPAIGPISSSGPAKVYLSIAD